MSRLLLFVCFWLLPGVLLSQTFVSPSQSGSGGVSLFLDAAPEVSFVNPSRLMLTDNNQKFAISVLSGGLYKSNGFTSDGFPNPKFFITPFAVPSNSSDYIFEENSDELLNAWFGSDGSQSLIKHDLDVTTIGLMFKLTDLALSVNHRLRGNSIAEISRGWYDSTFISQDDGYKLARNLHQITSFWHEIAIGFAWEQGLLSGLIGNRSAIYVGVNPKIILPVEFIDGNYQSSSRITNLDDTNVSRIHSLDAIASENSCSALSANPFVCTSNRPTWSSISGFGAGFDAGITWRFSLGEGIRLRNDLRPVSNYQISLSVAVNDIGFVSQSKARHIDIESIENTTSRSSISSVNREYGSSPESFFRFINEDIQILAESRSPISTSISYLTPATLSAGIGIELNRIKLGLEYQQQTGNLNSSADFSSLHFGNEISLIPFVSLRSGFIIQPDESVIYTAGFGFDTSWLSISASTMARQLETNNEIRPVVMNIGTLSLRF